MSDGAVKCSATWNDGGDCGIRLCTDAIYEMWLWNIPNDVEWFDTLLDMAM